MDVAMETTSILLSSYFFFSVAETTTDVDVAAATNLWLASAKRGDHSGPPSSIYHYT